MPNHVHAIVTPSPGNGLSDILHSWKSFSSHACLKRLADWRGPFWQKESFDHIVRNAEQLQRLRIYIAENPKGLAADKFTLVGAASRRVDSGFR
jgi:REP element-mobilizing transposase RayT